MPDEKTQNSNQEQNSSINERFHLKATLISHKFLAIVVVVSLIGTAFFGTVSHLGIESLDREAKTFAHEAAVQIATTFAIAKTMNAILSVASSTSIGAGVVVSGTISPGKILDPIDRLIDGFSDYLLVAATAACLTEFLLSIESYFGASKFVPFCLLMALIICLFHSRNRGWRWRLESLSRFVLTIAVLLRIGFPSVIVATHLCYEQFLSPRYEQSKAGLQDIADKIESRVLAGRRTEARRGRVVW